MAPPFTLLPEYPIESPEWFAARAAGVTASDMQTLGRGSLPAFAQIKRQKIDPGAGFVDTPYTRWGKEREPHIASTIEFLHGVPANKQIAVSTLDERWRATPDGWDAALARLGEYKTTIHDWPEEIDAIPRHYRDQVAWAQYVFDAGETIFAWEVNLGFTPGPIRSLIIPRDEERIEQLVEIAEDFWTFRTSDQPLGEYDDLIAAWAEIAAELAEVESRKEAIAEQIRTRAGGADLAVKSPFGSISLTLPSPRKTLNSAQLREDHPDLYASYEVSTPATKQTLRVTLPKG